MERLKDIALEVADAKGIVRWRDFFARGVTPATIARMIQSGDLERVGRGLYRQPTFVASEHQSIVETAKASPLGIICLLSALRYHDLTDQLPHAVWMMIGGKDRSPKAAGVRLKIVRASGPALTEGVVRKQIDGVEVAMTTPAKTVADCFKYRGRVGVDVAIEALRQGLARKAFSTDDFLRMAVIDRAARIARPYLEAMV